MRWWIKLALIFAAWSALAFLFASQTFVFRAFLRHPITWHQALMLPFVNYWVYAALTPGVLWLSTRYPIGRRAPLRVATAHVLGSLAFLFLHVVIRIPLYPVVDPYTGQPCPACWRLFKNVLVADSYEDIWIYGTIVAISQLWSYYLKYRDRELRASHLSMQLAQAQLKVLKMQLDPHFLFNTLHTISSLMHEDVEAADDMITRLSDLLRMSLENIHQPEVTLKREMEFLEGYLEIQRTRFRDRLTVHLDIDPVTLDAMVPNMILQPLVENAVTHGIAPRSTAGEINIRAQRDDGFLRLEVADNGQGLPTDPTRPNKNGVGLTNTQARLRQLYGEAHRFRLQNGAHGGAVVTLEIPFHVTSNRGAREESNENSHHHRG